MQRLRKFLWLPAAAAVVMTLASCAGVNRVTAERPRDEAFRSELKRELSTVNVAVEISASELSDNLNRVVKKELYKGATNSAGISAKVLKNGPIAVSMADNSLYLSLPVSIALEYGIFQTPPVATTLKFRVTPRVSQDWKLNADIYYLGLSDRLVDEMKIGPLAFKPRSIVEGMSQPVQRALSEVVVRKLNEKFPLKAEVAKAWEAAQRPIRLDKNYNAWLVLTPQEVLLYPLSAQNNRLKVSVGLKSFAEVVVGPEPAPKAALRLPNLTLASGSDKTFRVALNSDLFYKDLVGIASPLLLNKEFSQDGKTVIIKEFDLYGNGDHLVVKLQTAGSLEGTFYLTGRPVFNPQSNLFSVQDVDFDLQSRSLLLSTAGWLLHGTIRDAIQEKLTMDLSKQLAQARELADRSLARARLADNIFLNGSVKTVRLNDVIVQKDKISLQLYADGETGIVFH